MLHTKFHGNPEENIFERFLAYMGVAAIYLGHVTSIMSSNFQFPVAESFITKFGSEWHNSF